MALSSGLPAEHPAFREACKALNQNPEFAALRDTAFKKFLEYEKKHNITPNYIKMPVWAAEMTNSSYEKEIIVEDLCMRKIVIKFLGMVICVSSEIQTLDEIEVFCEEDEVQY